MPVRPIDFALDLLDRAEAIAQRAGTPSTETHCVEDDLLRSSWVFIGASLDTYFHEAIRRDMLNNVSKKARNFSVPLGDVDDMIALFLKNRQGSRPRAKLSNIIHQALLKETFQGSTNVERAFALLGKTKYWASIASAMNESPEEVKARLNRQYARRNKIAHEGDYSRQARPRRTWYDLITRAEVDEEIQWMRRFVKAADAL
ncbi:HEPN domain-containing protein [Brachybacterium sp. NPDC056505]|uniref:HEPN domain-containing protein n=1 Tax=Brachybacterium sp. NPDC056505 TaxID=3345843 RepID=UPI0036705963